MVKTCGDCIHADICKEVNGGWFSPQNPAYCKLFKNKDVPSKWISVEDGMPEPMVWVLCACRANIIEVLRYDRNIDGWGTAGPNRGYMKSFVTHWMSLPELPKED